MAGAPKVVSLSGDEIKAPFTPRPAVINELERALEMARSGEIIGLVSVYMHGDECTSWIRRGSQSRSMLGTLEIAKADFCDELRQQ